MRNEHTTKAYTFIRNRIVRGQYSPGMSLSAKALSEEIGVSRTPVHDALRQLETDGLVIIRPRQGATVKFLALQDFKEHCWLRKVLESNAAGLAASERTDADLEEIRSAVTAMFELVADPKLHGQDDDVPSQMAKQDVRFHIAVMNAAHNSLLKAEIVRLRLINRVVAGITPLYTDNVDNWGDDDKTIHEHQKIYEAIAARNVSASKFAMEAHIQDIINHSIKKMRVEETSQMSELGI